MIKLLAFLAIMILLSGCGQTVLAWRSNVSYQYATTEGKNDKAADKNAVNADKTNETQAAVSTNAGAATTAAQSHAE